jgi:sterol 3beta-glucosyltransferase
MVHARGLGAPPIPVEQLQLHSLIDAIKFMIDPKVNILNSVLVAYT